MAELCHWRTHRGAAGLQQGALDDLPVLRVEGKELLHVWEGMSLLDVEAAPRALADSEVADLRVVAHCGEAQKGENHLVPSPVHSLLTLTLSPFQAPTLLIHPKATQLTLGVLHPTPHHSVCSQLMAQEIPVPRRAGLVCPREMMLY